MKRYKGSIFEFVLARSIIIPTLNKNILPLHIIDISKKNFEITWNDALRDYRKIWKSVKNNYKPNSDITATLMYFYPQGAIFKVDNIIINYIGDKEVQLHEKLRMKIVGYDDINMWVIAK